MDLALQEQGRESAASYRASRAVWEAVCGNAAEGKSGALAALSFPRAGTSNTPPACPGSFGKLFPIGGAHRRFRKALPGRYVCEIHLRTGSSRVSRTGAGKPAESVERLQIALRYELAANGLNFNFILAVCTRPMCAARL